MIAWTDIESTGLDEQTGHLLEVSLVITDDELNEVAATQSLVRPVGINAADAITDDYVREMHTKNGLLDALAQVEAAGTHHRYVVEDALIEMVRGVFVGVPDVETRRCANCKKYDKEHYQVSDVLACPQQGDPTLTQKQTAFAPKMESALKYTPLAGSTVAFDRRWLRKHMPKLEALFSYRSIDVSSITELASRWAKQIYENRPGAEKTKEERAHRALDDIRESINILRYYRRVGFIGQPVVGHGG